MPARISDLLPCHEQDLPHAEILASLSDILAGITRVPDCHNVETLVGVFLSYH